MDSKGFRAEGGNSVGFRGRQNEKQKKKHHRGTLNRNYLRSTYYYAPALYAINDKDPFETILIL